MSDIPIEYFETIPTPARMREIVADISKGRSLHAVSSPNFDLMQYNHDVEQLMSLVERMADAIDDANKEESTPLKVPGGSPVVERAGVTTTRPKNQPPFGVRVLVKIKEWGQEQATVIESVVVGIFTELGFFMQRPDGTLDFVFDVNGPVDALEWCWAPIEGITDWREYTDEPLLTRES
jgi:hypothetical protein